MKLLLLSLLFLMMLNRKLKPTGRLSLNQSLKHTQNTWPLWTLIQTATQPVLNTVVSTQATGLWTGLVLSRPAHVVLPIRLPPTRLRKNSWRKSRKLWTLLKTGLLTTLTKFKMPTSNTERPWKKSLSKLMNWLKTNLPQLSVQTQPATTSALPTIHLTFMVTNNALPNAWFQITLLFKLTSDIESDSSFNSFNSWEESIQ